MAYDSNNMKSKATLKKYRTGYNLAWSIPRCHEVLLKAGFKAPGMYFRNNQQGGLLFALPREIPPESRFGENEAGFVMRHALKAGVTKSQGEGIKKMLSNIFQLRTGEDRGNFKKVGQVWKKWPDSRFGAPTQSVKAVHVIEPDNLRTAMTKEWTRDTPMIYEHWCIGYLLTHDWCPNGSRSQADLNERIKPGRHYIFPSEGYMYTQFAKGGRAKLTAGTPNRPWRAYRLCLCPGGKHDGPPPNYYEQIADKKQPTWCTTCPLSCYQVVKYSLGDSDPRIYPSLTSDGFVQYRGKEYISMGPEKMFPFLNRWLAIQGGNPGGVRYDSNMGRKALGKLCDLLKIKYSESFQIHGDLYVNWRYYQDAPIQDNHRGRTQSNHFETATKALRKIARFLGRGRTVREDPDTFSTTQLGQLVALQLRVGGFGAAVNSILDA